MSIIFVLCFSIIFIPEFEVNEKLDYTISILFQTPAVRDFDRKFTTELISLVTLLLSSLVSTHHFISYLVPRLKSWKALFII